MKRTRSLNPVERAIVFLGVMLFSVVVAYHVGRVVATPRLTAHAEPDPALLETLRARYGPTRNSEHLEEWIVRDFFQDERSGTFVDVGANHYQERSNTYFLETTLGWSGVAIEPQTRFASGYQHFRPKTRFVPLFVSDVSNQQATLYVPKTNYLVASSSREFAASYDDDITPRETTTTTLDDVLNRLAVEKVDFLSIDIELAEPQALAGFSIGRFRPRLVCIEAHPPVRQQLLDYFHKHGYVLVGKYWRIDGDNFWFAPLHEIGHDASVGPRALTSSPLR